jgi:O-antigen/teichoic acid export membrane protein
LVSNSLAPATFAIYAAGKTRVPFFRILSYALRDATAPRYSELESQQRHRDMALLWQTGASILLPVGCLIAAFLSATAHWSIPIYYGSAYVDSVPVFRVFAFSVFVQSVVGLDEIIRALHALRFLLLVVLASLICRIVLGLMALHHGSLWHLAATQLIVGLIFLSVRLIYIRRRLGVRWSDLLHSGPLASALLLTVLGLAGTFGIDLAIGDRAILALIAACVVWGMLIAILLWRQGLLRFALRRLAKRRPAATRPPGALDDEG